MGTTTSNTTKPSPMSKHMQSILANTELHLTLGYIRNTFFKHVPFDVVFVCYTYIRSPIQNLKLFSWKQKRISVSPKFMETYIECLSFNSSFSFNIHNPIAKNIIISNNDTYKKIINPSSCYVSNINFINKDIKQVIMSKCRQYCIANPSSIVIFGQSQNESKSNMPILSKQLQPNYCSMIIFDEKALQNTGVNNLYGFKVDLPSFANCFCDDMIYCEHTNSVIAYQSFYNKYNKLYYLNEYTPNWKLLTNINWTKSHSSATLTNVNKQLFISTMSGESVLFNLERNNWTRLPKLFDFYNKESEKKPLFAYDNFYDRMYRIDRQNKMGGYIYNFVQNKWIKMNFVNKLNRKYYKDMLTQLIFVNNQSPNILYSMINIMSKRFQSKTVFAYYDQRDFNQKQWHIVTNNNKPNVYNNDSTISMFT